MDALDQNFSIMLIQLLEDKRQEEFRLVSQSPGSARTHTALPYLAGSSEIEFVAFLFVKFIENKQEAISSGNLVSQTNKDQGHRDLSGILPRVTFRPPTPHFLKCEAIWHNFKFLQLDSSIHLASFIKSSLEYLTFIFFSALSIESCHCRVQLS